MKKNLFKVLFGVCLFMVGFNVNAETSTDLPNIPGGEGATDNTVTVGNVDTPVYNVNIYWNDLTFDWVYDADAEEFGWAPAQYCDLHYAENGDLAGDTVIYNDENCTEEAGVVAGDENGDGKYHLVRPESVSIGIEDYSTFGQIIPTVEWEANADYDYVDAEFTYEDEACVLIPDEDVFDVALKYGVYTDNKCSVATDSTTFTADTYYAIVEDEKVMNGGDLPDTARRSAAGSVDTIDGFVFVDHAYARNNYHLELNLVNKTTPTTTPTIGSEIGTITISVRAK